MATWKKLAYEDDVTLKTLWAHKGCLISASGTNTPSELQVGTDTYVLSALASETTGLKWIAQSVASHALSAHTVAVGAVLFGGYQADNMVILEVANAAALAALTAVVGKVAMQVDTLALYICTAV
jgi:hypothetical protein